MPSIKVRPYESFDKALNRFKKAVDRDDTIRIYCDKQFYEKPTSVRKRAKSLAKKRWQKRLEKEALALLLLRNPSRPKLEKQD